MGWLTFFSLSGILGAFRTLFLRCFSPRSLSEDAEERRGFLHQTAQDRERNRDILAADLTDEIRDKWTKPLISLPVHVDIPRLIKKIDVVGVDNGHETAILTPTDREGANTHQPILDLVLALATQFDPHYTIERRNTTTAQFYNAFGQGSDAGMSLMDFMNTALGEESSVVGVLKACTQSTLAPAVLKLKFSIGTSFSFKDVRGSWYINIRFVEGRHIQVIHTKSEVSFDDTEAGQFQFRWRLTITLDRTALTVTHADLHILDATISSRMPPSNLKEIRRLMQPYAQGATINVVYPLP
eukprot:TRINITY_DN9624_c0_g1_i1.p1 TRINITY_DN9624_c0_g1~~TRINITY_DN9624_c0_g1_i1.p1  ORF type:complete len:305 (-),score=45.53 TRINITY_DN9624_c0_g1_i1:45-938(-)